MPALISSFWLKPSLLPHAEYGTHVILHGLRITQRVAALLRIDTRDSIAVHASVWSSIEALYSQKIALKSQCHRRVWVLDRLAGLSHIYVQDCFA